MSTLWRIICGFGIACIRPKLELEKYWLREKKKEKYRRVQKYHQFLLKKFYEQLKIRRRLYTIIHNQNIHEKRIISKFFINDLEKNKAQCNHNIPLPTMESNFP